MPAYDPNSFSDGISHLEWNMLSENDHVPLMNKVLQGLYPPGSTVKPMNALALLRAGIDPHQTVFCGGAIRVGTGVFHRSEEHTSELQSLMRISYAVFCLKKKK